jgi:hypothetical protein
MKMSRLACGVLLGMVLCMSHSSAQERPYRDGTVWTITMIKVKPGMLDAYLRELLPARKKIMDEAMRAGLVVSEKMMAGPATGRDDFDLLLMTEYKNYAALDGLDDKFGAIVQKVVGSEEKQVQTAGRRVEVREIMGDKTMREILYK